MRQLIYMDNAATTRVCDRAISAMLPFMEYNYANVKGAYSFARKCEDMYENAREIISKTIGARPDEIYFNSGGTEGDNQAIYAIESKEAKIMTSKIEHEAILKSVSRAQKEGAYIEYIPVNKDGKVVLDFIKSRVNDFNMISVMMANNEVGVLQPIKKIGEIKGRAILHTDAVQAYGHVPIDVDDLKIDMLNVSAHKFGGPKGVGFMYVRKGIPIKPFVVGGGQEGGVRSGTSNTAAVAGMCAAAIESINNMTKRNKYTTNLRNIMLERIINENERVYVNGDIKDRLPGNINVSFEGLSSRALLAYLDDNNICVSRASACNNIDNSLSHVLVGMGISEERIRGSLRITLNHENTIKEVDYVCKVIRAGVELLRNK